jgi:GT2 family glycosyltransferase
MKIAVLLATYNRLNKTIACLESLEAQVLPEGVQVDVHLTDDASPDGTATAVNDRFPGVQVYHGNGSLFWAGGMRNSWRRALEQPADYYLLLNDDTVLNENALAVLLNSSTADGIPASTPAICVGSTVDSRTGKISYGGRILTSKRKWNSGRLIYSETAYIKCDVANANIMLVPHGIVNKIGILSDVYTHGLADYDYSLQAAKAGFDVLVAPGFLGTCTDDHGNNWKSQKTGLKERIKYLKSPKGLAYSEYLRFIRIHFPLSYPTAFCKLWMKTFFPFVWDTFKK